MSNKAFRPEVANTVENMQAYDTVFLAFPIWWYVAPSIIHTFLEQYDFSGKTIIPVATSGGSGMGQTNSELTVSCAGAELKDGKVFSANTSIDNLRDWAERYN